MSYVASQWNLELPNHSSTLVAGDSPANDIVIGKSSAGVKIALLDAGRRLLESADGKSVGVTEPLCSMLF